MYSIYIPKYPNEKAPFDITNILRCYTHSVAYDGMILSSPGYMSRNNTTIRAFINNFGKDLNISGRYWDIGLFNGMNGQIQLASGFNIRSYHEAELKKAGFNIINIIGTPKKDHRKMLFFLEKINDTVAFSVLDKSNYNIFLKNFYVRAVLIGSTNQSQQSYYGGKNKQASTGEADVFLISQHKSEKNMITNILKNLKENDDFSKSTIISKSMYAGKKDEEYLTDILENFLFNSLV